jgi:hypothetical protein
LKSRNPQLQSKHEFNRIFATGFAIVDTSGNKKVSYKNIVTHTELLIEECRNKIKLPVKLAKLWNTF